MTIIIIIIIIIIISNELNKGGIITLLLQDHPTMSVSRNSAKAVSRLHRVRQPKQYSLEFTAEGEQGRKKSLIQLYTPSGMARRSCCENHTQ